MGQLGLVCCVTFGAELEGSPPTPAVADGANFLEAEILLQ